MIPWSITAWAPRCRNLLNWAANVLVCIVHMYLWLKTDRYSILQSKRFLSFTVIFYPQLQVQTQQNLVSSAGNEDTRFRYLGERGVHKYLPMLGFLRLLQLISRIYIYIFFGRLVLAIWVDGKRIYWGLTWGAKKESAVII